tara:strand:- start:132 stop:452 length:321 start_codon:yes stop_codon:yes gene_type:complete
VDEVLGMSYLEPTTHASLALEDSMRHLPEFEPTTRRVDLLLQILASAREARGLGMQAATLKGFRLDCELETEALEDDLARLGYDALVFTSRAGESVLSIGWENAGS